MAPITPICSGGTRAAGARQRAERLVFQSLLLTCHANDFRREMLVGSVKNGYTPCPKEFAFFAVILNVVALAFALAKA